MIESLKVPQASSAPRRTLNVLAALLLAALMTFSLFFLMQFLIAGSGEQPVRGQPNIIGDISIPELDFTPITTILKPVEPLAPEELPDIPEPSVLSDGPALAGIQPPGVEIKNPELAGGAGIAPGDAQYLPIVTFDPVYPQRALLGEVEGWCLVAFTVNENGGVEDPVVLDAEPPGVFNSASLRAVSRFKFNPRTENGQAVKTPGVQYLFTFRLGQD